MSHYIPTKYNCLVDGSYVDLGQINSSNSLSISVKNATNSTTSILYGDPTQIKSTDIIAKIDGQSLAGDTTYTFGPAVPGRWVAVGIGGNQIATSTDGITWTDVSQNVFTGGIGRGVAWNGSLWVAVGQGTSQIATSPDGITWTSVNQPVFIGGLGVASNFSNAGYYGKVDISGNSMLLDDTKTNSSQTLEFVSDSYYNKGYENLYVTVKNKYLS